MSADPKVDTPTMEGKGGKQKREGPKPGKNPVFTKVTIEPTVGEFGTFLHDHATVPRLAEVVAKRMHPVEERVNHAFEEYDDYYAMVLRHISFLFGRQLATSLSSEQMSAYAGLLKSIAQAPCNGLSALMVLINNYGCVDEKRYQFTMIGQPILAFSYFVRAVARNDDFDDLDRESAIVINSRWPHVRRQLYDMCLAYVRAWAIGAGIQEFAFGGVPVRMTVPVPAGGLVQYRILVNHIGKSAFILRMLNIAAAIEPLLNGGAIDANQTIAFQALQVFFVDWNSAAISGKIESYSMEIESKLKSSFSVGANWVPIMAMKASGSAGQLLSKGTEHIYYSPVEIESESLTSGWMTASDVQNVYLNSKGYHVLPDRTQKMGLVQFVDGMMKNSN